MAHVTSLAVRMENQRVKEMQARIALQRQQREQSVPVLRSTKPVKLTAVADDVTQKFFGNIDTSAGKNACHIWQGKRLYNHKDETGWVRYEQALFTHPDVKSKYAPRILIALTYGYEPPAHLDVTPTCENHLCMNVHHYLLTPHGNNSVSYKITHGVDPAKFACEAINAA